MDQANNIVLVFVANEIFRFIKGLSTFLHDKVGGNFDAASTVSSKISYCMLFVSSFDDKTL